MVQLDVVTTCIKKTGDAFPKKTIFNASNKQMFRQPHTISEYGPSNNIHHRAYRVR